MFILTTSSAECHTTQKWKKGSVVYILSRLHAEELRDHSLILGRRYVLSLSKHPDWFSVPTNLFGRYLKHSPQV